MVRIVVLVLGDIASMGSTPSRVYADGVRRDVGIYARWAILVGKDGSSLSALYAIESEGL